MFCIALKPLGKVRIQLFPFPPISKLEDRMHSLTWVWQQVNEKENSEFKPINLGLKNDLIIYLVCQLRI